MLPHSHPASYKDPDGTIIWHEGNIYRLIFNTYKSHYDLLINSGLYNEFSSKQMLVSHEEVSPASIKISPGNDLYKVVKPQMISFISYPYEWSFLQLKSAALLTLDIQLKALEKNMSLKDATAYNVQFKGIDPIFIDTTSFENYSENEPWQAYGQFCRHFLGPLLLWAYGKRELTKLSSSYLDGIPLNVVSYSLPKKTKFNFFIFSHIHYHAKLEARYNGDSSIKEKKMQISKARLIAFITHLKNGIENLKLKEQSSEWTGYYDSFSYDKTNYDQKQKTVVSFIQSVQPSVMLDLGCNEGEFSLLCAKYAKYIVAADFDQLVIDRFFEKIRRQKIENILPLVIDFSNPSPGIGFGNTERDAFLNRQKYDVILALALVHHLSIGNNIPFEILARQFAQMCSNLIIEFVPKEDPQAQRLLVTKKDIFTGYTPDNFINSFSAYFQISSQQKLENSGRILFLMKRHA